MATMAKCATEAGEKLVCRGALLSQGTTVVVCDTTIRGYKDTVAVVVIVAVRGGHMTSLK